MANTIRAAKNTFLGGLVMDLSPDTTPNEVLTSALNATLVTFNGNELLLQNDMGNGRVETARLPEGYIPVGTCELGGIIYIVSYNPLTNKSLIGCFPSPERNISSEETGGTNQTLHSSDFLILNNGTPTGELKTTSVKKVLYNNKLNPGDKFIIYDKSGSLFDINKSNYINITDICNTSKHYGAFPKSVRIHVVALQDDGRINFLDSTLKWYDKVGSETYFINKGISEDSNSKPDIDSYRNMLESGYSVFQSKVSGKLALFIELEKITGFSCAYSIYTNEIESETPFADSKEVSDTLKNSVIKEKVHAIYWNFSWTTDDPNINPSYIVLTESRWVGKDATNAGMTFVWDKGKDGKYKQIPVKLRETEIDIPNSFPNSDYYYSKISAKDDISVSDIAYTSYADFLSGNYNKILEYNINRILSSNTYTLNGTTVSIYDNTNLVKLNFDEDSYHLPLFRRSGNDYYHMGVYYVNATDVIENSPTNDNGVYTTTNKGLKEKITSVPISDIVVNNYFHYPVYKGFKDFTIPYKQKVVEHVEENGQRVSKITFEENLDISNLIYHYEITPAMSYGLLREYSINGYIDFSKVGTGEINLHTWKYFTGSNILSLMLGLDAYVEDGKGIDEVVLEFYDNLGMAAAYHMGNKESYSGLFGEIIPLNNYTSSYKLTNINATGEEKYHCGVEASDDDVDVLYLNEGVPTKFTGQTRDPNTAYYLNDCGTIYSNMLYLVKVVVKYCRKDVLGNLDMSDTTDYRTFYKWVWTNGIFNEYYYTVLDYDDINLTLTLDVGVLYETNKNYAYLKKEYSAPAQNTASTSSSELYKNLSATVQIVGSSEYIPEITNNSNEEDSSETSSETSPGTTPRPPIWGNEVMYNVEDSILNIRSNSIISGCNTNGMTISYQKYENGATSPNVERPSLTPEGIRTYLVSIHLNIPYEHYDLTVNIPKEAITLANSTPYIDYNNTFEI